jgi:hypothetical protein
VGVLFGQVVRTEGLLEGEEMISRLRARVDFLHNERGTHHLVLLDTDMLVVRPLHHVFHSHDPFDVALTWRHELNMPVNGGILLVPRDRLNKAADFIGCAPLLPLRLRSGLGGVGCRVSVGDSCRLLRARGLTTLHRGCVPHRSCSPPPSSACQSTAKTPQSPLCHLGSHTR